MDLTKDETARLHALACEGEFASHEAVRKAVSNRSVSDRALLALIVRSLRSHALTQKMSPQEHAASFSFYFVQRLTLACEGIDEYGPCEECEA